MGNNVNLQAAKNAKFDEFYTTYETIEQEITHYIRHFEGKTVLCNCDDPFESNFCRFFLRHFNVLKLKRLICTSYKGSKVAIAHRELYGLGCTTTSKENGYVIDVSSIGTTEDTLSDEEINQWFMATNPIRKLDGDGDFRSIECIAFLDEADIIVTNPPFSLFKEMVSILIEHKKKFLIIGNQNALTYKEIFPLIQNNEVWTGYRFGDMKFRVPENTKPRKTRYWVDNTGQKWRSLGNAMWLTNLDIDKKHKLLTLTKKYNQEEYPEYDNFNAINVRRVQDIPMDYPNIMGVPITIIDKYNSEQFELVGEANHGCDNEYDLFKPTINGKLVFKRILIRNKKPINNYEESN